MNREVFRVQDDGDWVHVLWHCAGCEQLHAVPVKGPSGPIWGWNQSTTAPTLTPSVLMRRDASVCHIFIRDGAVEFLTDCTHAKAGQRIPLIPIDEAP